jgi:cell division septum initiation protein DivIVA
MDDNLAKLQLKQAADDVESARAAFGRLAALVLRLKDYHDLDQRVAQLKASEAQVLSNTNREAVIEAHEERRQILETAKADAANLLTKAKDDAHLIFRDAERKRDIMLAEARSKADDIEAKLANVHKVLAAAR